MSWPGDADTLRTVAGGHAKVVTVFPGRIFAALEASAFRLPLPGGFQIFHGTSYSVPRFAGIRTIGTFYDVAYRRFPEAYPPGVAEGFDRSVKRVLGYVDCVVTVSKSAKEDIVAAYGIDERRIEVIYPTAVVLNGASRPALDSLTRGSPPFMLFVGEVGPRKNIINLVRAFGLIAGNIPHDLVLAGPDGPLSSYVGAVRSEIAGLDLGDRVQMKGWVSEDELARLYSDADVVVLPSLHEGFGYPLVDAMAHGKPIVTSNNSAMAEVARDAALLVDPLKVSEIAEAMIVVAGNASLRSQLGMTGRALVDRYTIEAMVASFDNLYEVLGGSPN
jgi:glycosyltransferase involved in cell wall biosynthesis